METLKRCAPNLCSSLDPREGTGLRERYGGIVASAAIVLVLLLRQMGYEGVTEVWVENLLYLGVAVAAYFVRANA